VLELNAITKDEGWYESFISNNDALVILGLMGNPKLKKLRSEISWMAEKMSGNNPPELDDVIRHAKNEPQDTGIVGSFAPWSGLISGMETKLDDLAQQVKDNNTLVHEALHRAFSMIRATPALWEVCPPELTKNWGQGIGNVQFGTYNPDNTGDTQYSPEHSMIYSALGPDQFATEFNRGLYINYRWVRTFFNKLEPEFNDRYVDLTNDEQPIVDVEQQMKFYWRNLYQQTERAISRYLRSPRFYSMRPKLRPDTNVPNTPDTPNTADTYKAIDDLVQKLISANLSTATTDYSKTYAQLKSLMQDHFENLGYTPVDPVVQNYTDLLVIYLTNLNDTQFGSAYRNELERLLDVIKNHPNK
jgi:hypothetical protein